MTVKEYSQYLLDNFPHDAEVFTYERDWDSLFKSTVPILLDKEYKERTDWNTTSGYPEGVEQIVVI